MTVRTIVAAVGIAWLMPTTGAQAETACNATVVRERLAAMEQAFRRPDMQAKLSAAQEDWLDDEDFDDEASARHLGTVAAYHDIKRNFEGGSVEAACEMLTRTDAMVKTVLGDL